MAIPSLIIAYDNVQHQKQNCYSEFEQAEMCTGEAHAAALSIDYNTWTGNVFHRLLRSGRVAPIRVPTGPESQAIAPDNLLVIAYSVGAAAPSRRLPRRDAPRTAAAL